MLRASTARPFATDDARVVYPRLLEIENFVEVATARGQKPSCLARSLQGASLTNRLEIITGGLGSLYEHGQVKPVDLVFQPRYVLYRSFGATPSVSVAAAELFPLSGNRQLWNSYAMAYVSWFLFMPKESTESKSWNRRDSVRQCEDARIAAKPVRRHTVYNEKPASPHGIRLDFQIACASMADIRCVPRKPASAIQAWSDMELFLQIFIRQKT